MTRTVKLQMERSHAEDLLDRLYSERYDDHDTTTVAFEVPVGKAIGELEMRFPELAQNFNDD
jgi:hypothetical protein